MNKANQGLHLSLTQKLNGLSKAFNRQSLVSSSQSEMLPQPDIYPKQTEEQRAKLLSKYTQDKLYVVTQKYVANAKLCQLNQNINDLVGLKIPYDPANQRHIWFVDNGLIEGFMPCSALTLYTEKYPDKNLIEFDNDDSNPNQQSEVVDESFSSRLNEISFLDGATLKSIKEEV